MGARHLSVTIAPMILETTIAGHIKSVIYEKPETGFVVMNFEPDDSKTAFVAVGVLIGAAAGQPLRLKGHWETNRKFGKRFKFSQAVAIRPTSPEAIEKFLGSGMIKGIGEVMAARIVAVFGKNTLDILDADIDRLTEVPGIGKVTLRKIKKAWDEQKDIRQLVMFCQEIGLSTTLAPRIKKEYGANAEILIRKNPYRLALAIKGVGFLTADGIANKLGIQSEHPGRIESGIVHVLEEAGAEGNVYLPQGHLVERSARLLGLSNEHIISGIAGGIENGLLIVEKKLGDEPLVYSRPAFLIEKHLAGFILSLLKTPGSLRKVNPSKMIEWVEKKLSLSLAQAQKEAVVEAVERKMMVITGGPGTGKTTIIKAIIRILEALDQSVALAAPTGRAAKRMSEATSRVAMTVHRLLKFNPKKGDFEYDEKKPIRAQAVIVDEASMLDQWLATRLISAIHPKAKLIIVGDVDQLPSVGPGNVLSDVIHSGKVPTVRLTEIFRQDSAGLIVKNAHLINAGKKPILPKAGQAADFYFIKENDPQKLKEQICDLVARRLPAKFSLDPVEDIQVISPMHRGEAGVGSLNLELQRKLNPAGPELLWGGILYRRGDKVMQTVNNYDMEVFNGDVGRIETIRDGELAVRFDDRLKYYSGGKIADLVTAYALSIHKAQGSEYPAVVVPLSTQHYILLQRNLLYTAVTRARRLVVLAGSWEALFQALRNNRPAMRYTALAQRLKRDDSLL